MHLGNQHLRGTLPTCVLQIHNGSVSWCRRNYNSSHRPLNPDKQHKDVWSLKQSPSLSRELLKLLDELLCVELSRKVTLKLHEVHVCRIPLLIYRSSLALYRNSPQRDLRGALTERSTDGREVALLSDWSSLIPQLALEKSLQHYELIYNNNTFHLNNHSATAAPGD